VIPVSVVQQKETFPVEALAPLGKAPPDTVDYLDDRTRSYEQVVEEDDEGDDQE
jgi:hypothetical protein